MKPIILSVGENGRGLVYGLVEEYPTPGQPVKLYEARMILYYPSGGTFWKIIAKQHQVIFGDDEAQAVLEKIKTVIKESKQ